MTKWGGAGDWGGTSGAPQDKGRSGESGQHHGKGRHDKARTAEGKAEKQATKDRINQTKRSWGW